MCICRIIFLTGASNNHNAGGGDLYSGELRGGVDNLWTTLPPPVDTTKTRSDPQRVGMCKGERPVGAAKGKQTNTMASCQPLPPLCRVVLGQHFHGKTCRGTGSRFLGMAVSSPAPREKETHSGT